MSTPDPIPWRDRYGWPLGVFGQMLAATIGALAYALVRQQGYSAPFLVGILTGFGGRALSNKAGPIVGGLAFVLALAGSLAGEWLGGFPNLPLPDFLRLVPTVPLRVLILHVLGAIIGAWIAWSAPPRPARSKPPR